MEVFNQAMNDLYTPNKKLGLQMYGDPSFKQEMIDEYGDDFVRQCIDLTIKVVPNDTPEPKQITRGADSVVKQNSKIGVSKKMKGRYK